MIGDNSIEGLPFKDPYEPLISPSLSPKTIETKKIEGLQRKTHQSALPIFAFDSNECKTVNRPSHFTKKIRKSENLENDHHSFTRSMLPITRQKPKPISSVNKQEKNNSLEAIYEDHIVDSTSTKAQKNDKQIFRQLPEISITQLPTSEFSSLTLHTYEISDDQNLNFLPKDFRLIKNLLTIKGSEFLQQQGAYLVLEAQKTGQRQVIEIDNRLFIFTPSGKVYLSIREIGEGIFKTTYKTVLVSSISLEQLKAAFTYRAISLTKNSQTVLSEAEQQARENEINLHRHLKEKSKTHDLSNVCVAKSVFATNQNQIGIITEACHGDVNDLLEYNKSILNNADYYFIAMQMAMGVTQLHNIGIVHRDLKPDNFLYISDENGKIVQIKVADFGVSSRIQEDQRYESRKFPFVYVDIQWHNAPGYEGIPQFLKESDIYELGVTFYQIFTGTTQEKLSTYFYKAAREIKENDKNIPDYIAMRKFKQNPALWKKMDMIQDKNVKNFILRMLDPNIQNRPIAPEVAAFFHEKYIQAQDKK